MKGGLPDAVRRRLDPAERYGLRLTLLAVAALLVAVPFGLLLQQVVTEGPLTRLDNSLARQLHASTQDNRGLEVSLEVISFLGKPVFLAVVIAATTLWLYRRGSRRLAVYVAATTASGAVVVSTLKLLVGRPRPQVGESLTAAFGNSFPSGHSMSSTIAYGALLLAFMPAIPRRLRAVAVASVALLVVAIGISRLALAVHFLSDVVAGYVLGTAWLLGATAVFGIWREERGRPEVNLSEGVEPEEVPEQLLSR